MPYVIQHGLATAPTSKYSGAWGKWLEWCDRKGLCGRPADPFNVALYLNHLLWVNNTRGSITSAFYGIRWGHHAVGLPSPTDSPLVQLSREGATRLCPKRANQKEPLPVDTVKKIVHTTSTGASLMDLRFQIVCLIGFAGFLRINELLQTRLANVTFFPTT